MKRWVAALLMALAAGAAQAQADEARAKKIVMGVCFVCHGAEGESGNETFPRLAGQHAEYIARQLDHFKTGKRKSSTMAPMVANLTRDDMMALGRYFEKQTFEVEPPQDPALAAQGREIYLQGNAATGVAACASCHGADGRGTAALPRLAGQVAAYLESQLKTFPQRERTNDNAAMHLAAQKMSPREMAAVAQYLSGK
jgi:cytochrome c553